jgi:hypothetical protein
MNIIPRQIAFVLLYCLTLASVLCKAEGGKKASLMDVLQREFADAQGEIGYFDAYFDLNSDGENEAIVYVYGPWVCGSGGCNTLILAQDETGYKLISSIAISRPPIMVLTDAKNGWRSLAVFVSGGSIEAGHFAALQFDGKTYPENPSVAPARSLKNRPKGKIIIQDYSSFSEGKILKHKP